MKRLLVAVLREIFGLFVDDGAYAFLIVLWISACALLLPLSKAISRFGGPILFFGLVSLLLTNVMRSAKRLKHERAQNPPHHR